MKATGIVRRIDDLGRVVIPKEIRRTLRIREGDPLEIYTEKDGEVIFKKYSPMGDLGEFAGQICESIGKNTGYIAAVCDRDAIIAVHGVQKRELLDKRCSQELEQLMELRRSYRYQDGDLPALLRSGRLSSVSCRPSQAFLDGRWKAEQTGREQNPLPVFFYAFTMQKK